MAIEFPADPASQNPLNTFSPTSTPLANTTNSVTFLWDGDKWTATADGGGGAAPLWNRTSTTLSPTTAGDNVQSDGNGTFNGKGNFGGTWPASGSSEIRAGAYFGRNDTSSATAFEIYSGGTDAASRKIKFTAGGNATFSGDLKSGTDNFFEWRQTNGVGQVVTTSTTGAQSLLYGQSNFGGSTFDAFKFTCDGTATFNSTIRMGATGSNNFADFRLQGGGIDKRGAIVLSKADSSATQDGITFVAGGGTAAVIKYTGTTTFNLEYDNPARYTSTTNAEGVTESVYSGPTLDVKDSLTKLIAAVTAIRVASQAAGTLEDLKAAITTATADFDGGD